MQPDKNPQKIKNMFDEISTYYDRMNNLISLGTHYIVKYLAIKEKVIGFEFFVEPDYNEAINEFIREFKLDNAGELEVGATINVGIFEAGEKVDVTGISKGHGFSGTIKRYGAGRLKETHGSGPCVRFTGSLGANSTPSKVLKGKKMPGQFGNDKVTIQNLEVVKVDEERNVILVKGAVPGNKGGLVYIKNAVKESK